MHSFKAHHCASVIIASELMDGNVEGGNTVDSDSELSTVSSSRFSGLDEGLVERKGTGDRNESWKRRGINGDSDGSENTV